MEDDVVRGRCAAIVQHLLYSGENRMARPEQQRLLSAVAEELRQRAILMYRLCRAKQEKIALDQTEDAAYCVLAAVSSRQPSLWAVLTTWSRALRPRSPELRFGTPVLVTVRLKEVEQFIARSSHLQLALGAEDASPPAKSSSISMMGASLTHGRTRKHPREEENTTGAKLEPEIASRLAFDYFQLNTTKSKKFYAVVAAYEKKLGGVKLIEKREESSATRMKRALCGPRKGKRGIPKGDGLSNSSHNNYNGGFGLSAEEEGEDDMGDYSLLFPPALSLSSSSSWNFGAAPPATIPQCFFSSVSLNAVADRVEATCSALFFDRLQRCLRNPLLYSSLASMEEFNADMFHDAHNHSLPASQLGAAYLIASQGARVGFGGSLRSPRHFLHPLRARPTSLMPVPLQMVTSQQLWRRLLVAGLWLHVVGTELDDASAHLKVTRYCVTVVRVSQGGPCCSVCDTLVREKPILRLSALTHETENRDDGQPIRSWEEMKSVGLSASSANGSFCDELLRCLSLRLEQKVRDQSGREASSQSHPSTRITLANTTKRNGHASLCTHSTCLTTLRELVVDIEGGYPLPACRAALIGGPKNEDALLRLLRDESRREEEEEEKSTHHSDATANMSREVKELLETVPCIPNVREVDGVLECAACLQQFHQGCICPAQREPAEGIFLCHTCRLARGPLLLPPLRCSVVTNAGQTVA
ncbi:hypothetical protein BCY84_16469 [Trypanosoma cruzi cruzi]|uniref:Uncharacterized protein n=1 Tax=Trypanosoma cruzi TaxID=5693 RepID=A0A2V2VDJ4_TRYCR|nr:hypothetical protein BCY84_16469 [Trypanosoma cruzi cruzi]PWU93656.1 hypothetical protein C4B63_30g192 [Trypanosoma cruzi]